MGWDFADGRVRTAGLRPEATARPTIGPVTPFDPEASP
jgi:hypothetical protein